MEDKRQNKARLHPLLTIAAISVSIFSLVGIGALTGVLPHSRADRAADAPAPQAAPVEQFSAVTPPLPVASAPADAPVVIEEKPAEHKPAVRKTARHTPAPQPAPVQVAEAGAAPLPPPPSPVAAVPAAPAPVAAAPRPACADCGTVENFRQVEVKGEGSAVGAIAGGAGGAIIGHQFGRGSGKDLLTIAGAIGGALAGHEIEKNVRKKTRYEISVRMEDGSLRTVAQDAAPAWRVGDHVRVINNQVVAGA
jgi:outer membrane lipoprotein SlyB